MGEEQGETNRSSVGLAGLHDAMRAYKEVYDDVTRMRMACLRAYEEVYDDVHGELVRWDPDGRNSRECARWKAIKGDGEHPLVKDKAIAVVQWVGSDMGACWA